MSKSRENVIWQSADGTWSRGFFAFYETNTDDDDRDDEWDVEYDMGEFNWVSTGHLTESAAAESWHGSNPGGHWTTPYCPESVETTTSYDLLAADLEVEERGKPYNHFHGPSKASQTHVRQAMMTRAAGQIATLSRDREYYRLNRYGNNVDDKLAAAETLYAKLRSALLAEGALSGAEARNADIAMLSDKHDQLTKLIDTTTQERHNIYRGGYRYDRPIPVSLDETTTLRDATAAELEKARKSRPRETKPAAGGGSGPRRQPPGVPVGGQFAPSTRGRSDVTL